ncbi:MAG TPA: iron donor protein CyaY [Polyangiaceae bacterium]
MISEAEYETRATPELKRLLEALDALESDEIEAELESDILTLEFSDDTRYVINSHRAARQIWMAAERSAWHFDWDAERQAWVAQKNGDELWQALGAVIGKKLGHPVELARSS